MNLGVHKAGDAAADAAVDKRGAAEPLGHDRRGGQADLEAGLFHDLIAQHQNLRQHEHDKEHGDDRAPAEALADADNGGLRGDLPDEEARGRQDGAGGQHCGEREVQRLDESFTGRHLALEVGVPCGNNDSIVDIGAHLNRGNNEVAHEEDVGVHHRGEGEVDPDTALNYQNQQNGQAHGHKGEHQHQNDEHHGQDTNHQVIPGEGHGLVIVAGGVADKIYIVLAVVGVHDAVERFQDNTRWMIEFSVLRPSTAYGSPGEEMRLFLTEDGYQAALQSQQRREIKIKRYARVIEGHILDFKPGKRRRS